MPETFKRQSIAQQIVELIRTLGLNPGDTMPTELALMERLHVSRNTVREAIRELRAWGIVEVRHGHGTYVGSAPLQALAPALVFRTLVADPGGLQALENLARVREILETSAIAEVSRAEKQPDLERLLELCERIGEPGLSAQADREFHSALYKYLPNPLIGQLVDVFWDAYHEAHELLSDLGAHAHDEVATHRHIVHALREGSPERAQEAMRGHFHGIYRRLAAAREKLSPGVD